MTTSPSSTPRLTRPPPPVNDTTHLQHPAPLRLPLVNTNNLPGTGALIAPALGMAVGHLYYFLVGGWVGGYRVAGSRSSVSVARTYVYTHVHPTNQLPTPHPPKK